MSETHTHTHTHTRTHTHPVSAKRWESAGRQATQLHMNAQPAHGLPRRRHTQHRLHTKQVKLQDHVNHMVTVSHPRLHPGALLTSFERSLIWSSPLLLAACLTPWRGENCELFCIQHGNLLGKRSLWNWKLNVTEWELLFVLDFVPPLPLYPFVILFTLAPFVSPSFTICLFLSLSLSLSFSLSLLQFPFSFGFLYCHSAPLPTPRALCCKLIYHSVLAIFPLLHPLYFYFNCLVFNSPCLSHNSVHSAIPKPRLNLLFQV